LGQKQAAATKNKALRQLALPAPQKSTKFYALTNVQKS
jgi:hypothetical protein